MLFLLSVLPPLLIIVLIYYNDKFEKEPLSLIIKSFFFGCVSILPAIILEIIAKTVIIDSLFLNVFVGIALVEEGLKYLFLKKGIFPKLDFNEPYDGIVYAVTISLGFATIENLAYVYGNPNNEYPIAILRMFSAIPLHAVCGIIMGYYVGLAKFSFNNSKKYLIMGLIIPTIIHGLYNYFISTGLPLIFSITVVIIGIIYSKKAIKIHQKKSPFNPEN